MLRMGAEISSASNVLHHCLDTVNTIRAPPFDRRIAVSPVSALIRVSFRVPDAT